MARIATPGGARPYVPVEEETPDVTVSMLYGDPADPVWAAAWRADGAAARRAVLPPDGRIPDEPVPRAAPRDDSCANGAFTVLKRLANPSYRYAVTQGTMPVDFRRAMVRGHHAWDVTPNSCGYADQDNVSSSYRGVSSASVHTVSDGRSVVDFGRLDGLCGSAATLACTWWCRPLPARRRPVRRAQRRVHGSRQ
jgi:hypothetical protein